MSLYMGRIFQATGRAVCRKAGTVTYENMGMSDQDGLGCSFLK